MLQHILAGFVLSQAGSVNWDGQGVDALMWSEKKLAVYTLQFIAPSYANEVCFVSCIGFWNQAFCSVFLFTIGLITFNNLGSVASYKQSVAFFL